MSFSLWATPFTDNVSTIPAAFLNQIRVDLSRAVDGTNGGTYTPASQLTFDGTNGVRMNFSNGGFIIGGAAGMSVESGSLILLASGATLSLASGATATITGTATWSGANNYPALTPARTITRRGIRLLWTTYNQGASVGPATADTWIARNNLGAVNSGAAVRTAVSLGTGPEFALGLIDPPTGSSLTSVEIISSSITGTASLTLPTYRLIRWTGAAVVENLSSAVTDAHTGAQWAVANTNATTTVTPTSTVTIDDTYQYGIYVVPPYEAGTGASMLVVDVKATYSVTSLRP